MVKMGVSRKDGLVKSRKSTTNAITAKAGIKKYQMVTRALYHGFRRGDDFLRFRQGKGVEKKIKTLYNMQGLLFLDMDPGMSEANILNRIHFIVMTVREGMKTERLIARIIGYG